MAITASTPIPSSSVALVLAALDTIGWDRQRCAAHLGVSVDDLSPQGTLRVRHAAALLDLAVEHGLGAHSGPGIPRGAMGLLEHLCGAAPTARAALTDLARYFRLVAFGATVSLGGDTLILDLPATMPTRHARLLAELLFSYLLDRLVDVVALRADLPGEGGVEGPWQSTHNGATSAALLCSASSLDRANPATDAALRDLLQGYASQELSSRPESDTVESQVRRILLDQLPGAPSGREVARALGVSERSLRRALEAENLTFSSVRTRCLRDLAEKALQDDTRTIGEVAWLLGYSESSAFHRAFKKWTGTSPVAFRKAGRDGP